MVERNQFTLDKNSSQDGDNQRHGGGGGGGGRGKVGGGDALRKMLLESAPKRWETKKDEEGGEYEIYLLLSRKQAIYKLKLSQFMYIPTHKYL